MKTKRFSGWSLLVTALLSLLLTLALAFGAHRTGGPQHGRGHGAQQRPVRGGP